MSLNAPHREQGSSKQSLHKRERAIVFGCLATVAGMVALTYASAPLYDLFCKVTGYGGTTQQAGILGAQALAPGAIARDVTVRFDASVIEGMPWRFVPEQKAMNLKVGEPALAFFRAENLTDEAVTGTATYNVTPQKAGVYFTKVQCFCFTEQRLGAREGMDMAVSFFVDPAIADDPDMDDVKTITLSYTFFPKKADKTDSLAAMARTRASQSVN